MSEFKEKVSIVRRSTDFIHKGCGGRGEVKISVITELPKPLLESAKGNPLAIEFLKKQLPLTVRLVHCLKCHHREVEEVAA